MSALASQVILVPILISAWGTRGYGEWISLTAFTSYIIYFHFGLPTPLRTEVAYAYSRDDQIRVAELLGTSVGLSFIMSFIGMTFGMTLIAFVHLPSILNLDGMDLSSANFVAAMMIAQICFQIPGLIMSSILAGVGFFPLSRFIDSTRMLFEAFCVAILVVVYKSPPSSVAVSLPIVSLIYLVITGGALFRVTRSMTSRFSYNIHSLRSLAGPMFASQAWGLLYLATVVQAPRVALAHFAGPVEVAVFAVAQMVVRLFRLLTDIPANMSVVELSMAVGRNNHSKVRQLINISGGACFWTVAIFAPFVILFGPQAIAVFTSKAVSISGYLLSICGAIGISVALALPAQQGLVSVNRLGAVTTKLLVVSIPLLLSLFWLAKNFGALGAAGGVAIMEAVFAALCVSGLIQAFRLDASGYIFAIISFPRFLFRHLR